MSEITTEITIQVTKENSPIIFRESQKSYFKDGVVKQVVRLSESVQISDTNEAIIKVVEANEVRKILERCFEFHLNI